MTPQDYDLAVKDIVRLIIKPTIDAGGETADILGLLECIVTGVLLSTVKPGGDEPVLNAFINAVRERMAEFRLAMMETEGEA